jgi:hypothetical protein
MFNIFSVHVVSLIVAGLAVVAIFVHLPFVSDYAFWLLVAAYIMLAGYRSPPASPVGGTAISLNAEQRRALAMLANAGPNGATQALLSTYGFGAALVAGLVNQGFARLTPETISAGGKLVEVAMVRITEKGLDALRGS